MKQFGYRAAKLSGIDAAFQNWIADLEKRHFAELTFPEVSRALRALSSTYVERRNKIAAGAALSGAGKRAAFALFYAPLHYLLVKHIQSAVGVQGPQQLVVDLGCGTGVAGVAVAQGSSRARILAIDRNPWALGEAAHTYRAFGIAGQTRQADAARFALPKNDATFVAAFTMNELPDGPREALLQRLLERARTRGDRVLVVEPVARGAARWWDQWAGEFQRAGGRADEWRFQPDLPEIVGKLDRAAGLDHRELTGRSLWIGGGTTSTGARAASS